MKTTTILKIIHCTLLFLLMHAALNAQKTFPGFYITSTGETINGMFPHFKEWSQNPGKVQFETNTKKQVELTPDMCQSFAVSGYDTYESIRVKRMTNPNRHVFNYQDATQEETFEDIHVFLHRIYDESNVKLYEYRDNKRENYFISVNDTFTELFFKIVYKKNERTGIDELFNDKGYIDQLKSLFSSQLKNDNKLTKYVNSLRYDNNDLITFINWALGVKKQKQKNKYPSEFAVIAGASYNSLKVTPYKQFVYPTTIDYPSNFTPVIGLSYTTYGGRSLGKNMYSGELKYYRFKHSANTSDEEWEYKANALTIGFGIGRKWINKQFISWYTSIIPTAMLLSNNTESKTYLNEKTVTSEGINVAFRFGLQTGVIIKRFGIWAEYNLPANDIQTYQQYDTFHQSIQAGVDWRFKL